MIANCTKTISNTSQDIGFKGHRLTFKGELYTGKMESKLDAVKVKIISKYKEGLLHGEEIETYENGQVSAIRFYEEGKHVGVHRGWYPDGVERFRFEYKNGRKHGEFWDWTPKGNIYSYTKFNNDFLIGKKVWREDGQIYINLIADGNKIRGLKGSKLCRQVRSDENGNTKFY